MEGAVFRINDQDFLRLNKFLESVERTPGAKCEFLGEPFSCRGEILRALGFKFLYHNICGHAIYCYQGTCSPTRIVVSSGVDISDQWTIVSRGEVHTHLNWKGPQSSVEETILPHLEDTFLSAQEAREIADKALQTTKTLQKVREAAEAGNYELTLTKNPGDRVCQHLSKLGFKISDTDFFRISW